MESNRRLLRTFFFHFRPRTVAAPAMRFTYTWGLGGSATLLACLSIATGVMLKFVYSPLPDRAYESVVELQSTLSFGPFVRNTHHWSANLLIGIVLLHLLRIFYTGAYQGTRKLNWVIGLTLFSMVILFNFTGYLLPWDQLAYWAVTISVTMLAYLPLIGDGLREVIVGGKELGSATLFNFYVLHTAILPMLLIFLLAFHFWRIRRDGGLAAISVQEDGAVEKDRIEIIPHLLVRELVAAAVMVAIVLTLAALRDAPLGPEANPGLSPNPTKAPWYFAGLQEMLLLLHPLLAVAVIPMVLVGALFLLPFLPIPVKTPGVWFGSPTGRRLAAAAVMAGTILTPCWIVGYANGLQQLAWLAPVLVFSSIIVIYLLFRRRFGATVAEAIQGVFSFLLAIFLIMTISGTWFRGASMVLIWPWL